MKNYAVNFGKLTETQKSFFIEFFDEHGIEAKVQNCIDELIHRAVKKGYCENDCIITLDYPKIERMDQNEMYTNYYSFYLNINVDDAYKLTNSIISDSSYLYISSNYSKKLNNIGKLLKAQYDVINEQEKKQREEKNEQERIARQQKEEQETLLKAESERKILSWIESHGSELLKNRVLLGFDFNCLAKTEYTESVLGKKIVKWNDFSYQENEIKRPTLEQMKSIFELEKKIDGKGKRHSLFKGNGTVYVNLSINVPFLGIHDVLIEL
jgi:hypothetical protein